MHRVALALLTIPVLLTALLAGAMEVSDGKLGSVTMETFELGLLPIVIFAALILYVAFLPMLWLASRIVGISWWSATVVGFLSVFLPILIGSWSSLTNSTLRLNYRLERLGDNYPWLILGAVGGLLYWLLAVRGNAAFAQESKQSQ